MCVLRTTGADQQRMSDHSAPGRDVDGRSRVERPYLDQGPSRQRAHCLEQGYEQITAAHLPEIVEDLAAELSLYFSHRYAFGTLTLVTGSDLPVGELACPVRVLFAIYFNIHLVQRIHRTVFLGWIKT